MTITTHLILVCSVSLMARILVGSHSQHCCHDYADHHGCCHYDDVFRISTKKCCWTYSYSNETDCALPELPLRLRLPIPLRYQFHTPAAATATTTTTEENDDNNNNYYSCCSCCCCRCCCCCWCCCCCCCCCYKNKSYLLPPLPRAA